MNYRERIEYLDAMTLKGPGPSGPFGYTIQEEPETHFDCTLLRMANACSDDTHEISEQGFADRILYEFLYFLDQTPSAWQQICTERKW